jgi:hypothetical protein
LLSHWIHAFADSQHSAGNVVVVTYSDVFNISQANCWLKLKERICICMYVCMCCVNTASHTITKSYYNKFNHRHTSGRTYLLLLLLLLHTITITTRKTATGTEGTTVAIVVPYHYALVRRKSIWSSVIVLIMHCTEFVGCQIYM